MFDSRFASQCHEWIHKTYAPSRFHLASEPQTSVVQQLRANLGMAHERRVMDSLRAQFGERFLELTGEDRQMQTLAALKRPDAEAAGKTEEEIIAARKAAEEASERIRLLEKNILDLKSSIPAPPSSTVPVDAANTNESFWSILASPARDLIMQGTTVLLLAALVLLSVIRRQTK